MLASDPVLDAILAPLARHYANPEVVEVRISRPCEITVERRGAPKIVLDDDTLTIGKIEYINKTLSNRFGLTFDAHSNPKVSCVLPNGHRFESLVGSSGQTGVNIAIRCKHPFVAEYSDYGLDDNLSTTIKDYVTSGKIILVSGGTNTGKTTLLNLLLSSLPNEARLVLMEDTPEIDHNRFSDCSTLIAGRGSKPPSMLTWEGLYDHANRISPEYLIFSEISVDNAFVALSAMNSGIKGFICTIHANSSEQVLTRKFEQLLTMSGKSMEGVNGYMGELVDMVIQIVREDGRRFVNEVYLPKENRYLLGGSE